MSRKKKWYGPLRLRNVCCSYTRTHPHSHTRTQHIYIYRISISLQSICTFVRFIQTCPFLLKRVCTLFSLFFFNFCFISFFLCVSWIWRTEATKRSNDSEMDEKERRVARGWVYEQGTRVKVDRNESVGCASTHWWHYYYLQAERYTEARTAFNYMRRRHMRSDTRPAMSDKNFGYIFGTQNKIYR